MASSELLKQIQAGKKLKKAVTSDRSAPIIETSKSGGGVAAGGSVHPSSATPSVGSTGPPQLGGLFAGGIPKLKPVGSSAPVKSSSLAKPPSVPERGATPKPPVSTTALSTPPAPPARPPPPPSAASGVPIRAPPPRPSSAMSAARSPPPLAPPPATPPRQPIPPPARPGLQSRLAPAIPPRKQSPQSQPSLASSLSLSVPAPPARNTPVPPAVPARKSGRAPPPPPPTRLVLYPPSRKAPTPPPGPPLPPARPRAVSESESQPIPTTTTSPARRSLAPPPPPPPPPSSAPLLSPRTRNSSQNAGQSPVPTSSTLPPTLPGGRRAVSTFGSVTNGDASLLTRARKIPTPPPNAGSHIFPTDFPQPRPFQRNTKQYTSGRTRGSQFDLKQL